MLNLPLWDEERLDQDRLTAADRFRDERMKTAREQYMKAFEAHENNVRRLLEESAHLRQLRERAAEIVSDHGLLVALSGVAGPPISVQDLSSLVGGRRLSSSAVRTDPTLATRVVETVLNGLDGARFPWIREEKEKRALTEDQLFWAARIAENHLGNSSETVELLGTLHSHRASTEVTKAKILEIPWKDLDDMRDEYLKGGRSDWLAWSSAVGSRRMAKSKRNHLLKYYGHGSRMNEIIARCVQQL